MNVEHKQLYAMPDQLVGHYVSHSEPEYYKTHLVPVARKRDIPTGMYACGLTLYRCPNCGHTAVKVSVFLPVREEEKIEDGFYFQQRELDGFVRQSVLEQMEPPQRQFPGAMGEKRVIRDTRM